MEKLLTMDEVCETLQIKKSTLYSWCHMKKLPYIKVGSKTRFREEDILKWLDEHVKEAKY